MSEEIACCGTHKLQQLEKKWKTDNLNDYDEFKKLEEKLTLRAEEENGCKGMKDKRDGWISTYSGKKFYIFNPQPEEIDINDIAHSLSMICRFGGHTKSFYSVSQHSILVSQICDRQYSLEGLLHDATECFIGDMVRPIKRWMDDFKSVEENLERAIAERFNLSWTSQSHEDIKTADNIALVTEARDLLTTNIIMDSFADNIRPLPKRIKPFRPKVAEQKFLERFYELNGARCVTGTNRSFTL